MPRSPHENRATEARAAYWPRPRPRLLFVGLLAWIAFTLAVSVLLAPPIYEAIGSFLADPPHFRKVTRRVVQAAALLFALLALRGLGVRRPRDIGFGAAPDAAPRFGRAALLGFLVAAAGLAIDFAAGARHWDGPPNAGYVTLGLAGTALVAFLEEGCFRGALLFPFGQLRGAALAAAALLNSALFATVHFVRGGMRGVESDFAAAWAVWSAVPAAVGDHFESWIGLFAVGVVLDLTARRHGDAWGVTGMHFGAAFALQLAGRTSDAAPGATSLLFVDGLLPGFGFAALLAIAFATHLAWSRLSARSVAT